MPKHTMHCTPDLVTVFPWRFIYGSCGCVVDWLTSDLPRQCFPSFMPVCGSWVCMASWKTIRPNQNPQKTRRTVGKKEKKKWKLRFNAQLRFFQSLFSVLLLYDVLSSHFHEYEWCDSKCFVCKQIYCSNGMFYQRKYEKCKTFAPCIKT